MMQTDKNSSGSTSRWRSWAGLVALLLLLSLAAAVLFKSGWFPALEPEQLALRFSASSLPQQAVLVLLAIGFAAIGLPRQLLAFVGGYVYGVLTGTALSLLLALCGCVLAFYCSRYLLRSVVQRRFASLVSVLDRFVVRDVFIKVLILRLQPLGTNLMTNLAAGISQIRPLTFFTSSAVGYVPQMLVFALAGSGVSVGSNTQVLLSAVLLVIAVALGWWLYHHSEHGLLVADAASRSHPDTRPDTDNARRHRPE